MFPASLPANEAARLQSLRDLQIDIYKKKVLFLALSKLGLVLDLWLPSVNKTVQQTAAEKAIGIFTWNGACQSRT